MILKSTGVLLYRQFENDSYNKVAEVELVNCSNSSLDIGNDLIFKLTDEYFSENIKNLDQEGGQFVFMQDTNEKTEVGLMNFESTKTKMIAVHSSWSEEISIQIVIRPKNKPVFAGISPLYYFLPKCDIRTSSYLRERYGL